MKKTILYSFVLALLFCNTSFAQNTVNLKDFDQLKVSGSLKVKLIPSSETKAEVEMLRGDFEDLKIEVQGSKLVMRTKKSNWGSNTKAEIDLYYKSLDEIDASAGSTVKGTELIKGGDFVLEASSGSTINIQLDVEDLEADVSSGATIKVSGETDTQKVDVSSGASFKAGNLASQKTDVEASSGASAKVYASKSITAKASSGGSVKYDGDPKDTDIETGKYSGGSVRKM